MSQKVTTVSRHTQGDTPTPGQNVTKCHKKPRPCHDTHTPQAGNMSRHVTNSHDRDTTHSKENAPAGKTCHETSQKSRLCHDTPRSQGNVSRHVTKNTTVSRPAHGGARRCAQSRPFRGQTACPPPAAHFIRMTRLHFSTHTGCVFEIGGQRVACLEFVSTFSVETQWAH